MCTRQYGRDMNDQDNHPVRRHAEIYWPDHELQAKRLIRSLKDQPPHVTDAGASCVSTRGVLNEMLEAMARS